MGAKVVHDGRVLHRDEVIVGLAGKLGMRNSEGGTDNGCPAGGSSELRPASSEFRLAVVEVCVHSQKFTKLANCFNVTNNAKGTNTNRLVVLRKLLA